MATEALDSLVYPCSKEVSQEVDCMPARWANQRFDQGIPL